MWLISKLTELSANINLSFTTKLIAACLVVEVAALSYLVWDDTGLIRTRLLSQKQKEIAVLSTLTSSALASMATLNNKEQILDIADGIGKLFKANYVAITTPGNETIMQRGEAESSAATYQDLLNCIKNGRNADSYHISLPLEKDNTTLGRLQFEFDTNEIEKIVADVQRRDILDALIVIIATMVILFLISNNLTSKLSNLTAAVTEYIDNRRTKTPIPDSNDELGKLGVIFSRLITSIDNKTYPLKESEEILQAILDNSPAIIYAKDIDGRYLLVNKQFAMFFNSDAASLLGKTDFELFPHEIAAQLKANDDKVLASKSIQQMEEIVPRGGDLKTHVSTKFCLFDKHDNVYAVCGITTDISEHVRNEKRLKESEENLRSLANNASDGILVNQKGKHIFTNQRMADIVNTTVEEIIGTEQDFVLHPSEKDTVVQRFKRRMNGRNEPVQYDTLFVDKKTGAAVPVEITAFISQWNGEPAGVVFVRDIKERKKTEAELNNYRNQLEGMVQARTAELENAVRELESFSYSVSHDLRSPLRSIDGFSQLLLEDYQDKLDEDGIEYLRRVRKAAQRMAQLIDDILLLSRVSRHALSIEPVNLSEIAEESAAALIESHPEHKVNVQIELNMTAKGDRRLLRIVMDNLMDNAWKYTGKNNEAEVTCGCKRENGRRIYFVRDNGIGFDMQYAKKLFSAFQRLHGIDEFPGTGIGLATVKRIINRHGGEVWAEAQPGKGAVFYFTLSG